MKKIIITAVLILILQAATPYWWWVMVVPLVVAFASPGSGWGAFRMGLIGAGAVWLLASLVLFLTQSQIIAVRIASMMNLGSGWVLVLLTGVIGMLAGGVAGATGEALRSCFRREEIGWSYRSGPGTTPGRVSAS
jgi:hypothetical protein